MKGCRSGFRTPVIPLASDLFPIQCCLGLNELVLRQFPSHCCLGSLPFHGLLVHANGAHTPRCAFSPFCCHGSVLSRPSAGQSWQRGVSAPSSLPCRAVRPQTLSHASTGEHSTAPLASPSKSIYSIPHSAITQLAGERRIAYSPYLSIGKY